ncbi:hypothetical protein QR680_005898 [Steinernema hermaphroditum]|uniref:Saccharopine dehydrogenase NADP binding domain-containing protein n=1 Tax=Steinernema hermaphroditum TaxID=289476 RepID=A0AA39HVY3_9BILA|nr:hypothetical protein QR680_005898 [Steinernema hermaphroditum]
MASDRFDLVFYGVTGFTGSLLLEYLIKSEYANVTFAVAGRNVDRIRSTLVAVGERCGEDLTSTKIIVADSGNPASLAEMAKQAKVIINAVGPYRLHGEAVVKAAIENGAHHIDIAGEPAWLEKMEMKFNQLAREKKVFVVGACGFDSLPCDLGIHFLKRKFKGDLCYVETMIQIHYGKAGYSISSTTYDTLIHGLSEERIDELRRVRNAIMPEKMPLSEFKPPKRSTVWYSPETNGYATTFYGADKSIVTRSQYFDFERNQRRPVRVETYFRGQNCFWANAQPLWLGAFRNLVQYSWTREFMKKHPELFSFGMFSKGGPSREQLNQTSFTYWFFGQGWNEKLPVDEEHSSPPDVRVVTRCVGPDPAYLSTAACVVSSAVTLLEDGDLLPKPGGVFTTASAFGNTRIYERLAAFGITFDVVKDGSLKAHL